jgi:GNAT superfamily N-acetyltransferase
MAAAYQAVAAEMGGGKPWQLCCSPPCGLCLAGGEGSELRRGMSTTRSAMEGEAGAGLEAGIELSDDPARLQLDTVYRWLSGCYWSPGIRREVVERAFAHSLSIGAYAVAGGAQLGVARLVTDQATFAWLCDVYVDEPARGKGVGRAMVQRLLVDPRLQTLRRWCLATRDAHGVYAPLGFGAVDATKWMERLPDPATWQGPPARPR